MWVTYGSLWHTNKICMYVCVWWDVKPYSTSTLVTALVNVSSNSNTKEYRFLFDSQRSVGRQFVELVCDCLSINHTGAEAANMDTKQVHYRMMCLFASQL